MILDQENAVEFIKTWQTCTLAEVATKFGISKRDASAIATSLRAKNVELRDQRRVNANVDFDALADVARECEVCNAPLPEPEGAGWSEQHAEARGWSEPHERF